MAPGPVPSLPKKKLEGTIKLPGATLEELTYLRLLAERAQNATQLHVRIILCMLRAKQEYFTLEEIIFAAKATPAQAERTMRSLAQNGIVEKDGCLYKKPHCESIIEKIACK